ncbi:DUF5325 family protein [Evansella sp. AB-rgal1]|uniref:DUF5325 family protein n=1 Tax=Evansella sp. AB-rgal1 TaxID=3242696 RepID=UPI00359E344A
MDSFNWRFFTLALLGIIGLMGIGVGIAEGSALIAVGSFVFSIVFIAWGFMLKRKYRQTEQQG